MNSAADTRFVVLSAKRFGEIRSRSWSPATAWSLQIAKWLPAARTGPFRVVKVISLVAVALAHGTQDR
jgi:hypothetical protein